MTDLEIENEELKIGIMEAKQEIERLKENLAQIGSKKLKTESEVMAERAINSELKSLLLTSNENLAILEEKLTQRIELALRRMSETANTWNERTISTEKTVQTLEGRLVETVERKFSAPAIEMDRTIEYFKGKSEQTIDRIGAKLSKFSWGVYWVVTLSVLSVLNLGGLAYLAWNSYNVQKDAKYTAQIAYMEAKVTNLEEKYNALKK